MKFFPAGAEFIPSVHAAMLTFANRALLTAYPFVMGTAGRRTAEYLLAGFSGRPLLLDSGIFTMRSKLHEGQRFTEAFFYKYLDRYIQFIKDTCYKGAIIELDCHDFFPGWQGVLQKARERLHQEFGERVLYCYHPWSGLHDLGDLVRAGRRTAFSLRVLAKHWNTTKTEALRLTLAQAGVPMGSSHIHVLGDSSEEVLSIAPNNFTCDSTTWSMIVRYGRAMPATPYAVTWWRRDKLEAPACVTEVVQAKTKELYRNYWLSPEASRSKPEPKYTLALAYALVASILYARSFEIKFPASTVRSEVIHEQDQERVGGGHVQQAPRQAGGEDRESAGQPPRRGKVPRSKRA